MVPDRDVIEIVKLLSLSPVLLGHRRVQAPVLVPSVGMEQHNSYNSSNCKYKYSLTKVVSRALARVQNPYKYIPKRLEYRETPARVRGGGGVDPTSESRWERKMYVLRLSPVTQLHQGAQCPGVGM